MSRYLRNHPEEAYKDERKCLMKAFKRRRTPWGIAHYLLAKTYITFMYRKIRHEIDKIKLPQ